MKQGGLTTTHEPSLFHDLSHTNLQKHIVY